MSDAIFPDLPGLSWEASKTPEFYTVNKTSPTGLDVSAVLHAFPRWHFSLSYEFLIDDGTAAGDLQQLVGFFLQRYGNVDDFLFLDPADNLVTNQAIGRGDGGTRSFQLCRNFGGFIEPVYGVKGRPIVTIGDVPTSAFKVSSKGLVTFNEAPAPGSLIAWSGQFYFRVKFKESMLEVNNFMHNLWEAKSVNLVSVKRVISE